MGNKILIENELINFKLVSKKCNKVVNNARRKRSLLLKIETRNQREI